MQEKKDSLTGLLKNVFWGQANFSARYFIKKDWSLAGRIEAFTDNEEAEVYSITNEKGFNTLSYTLGINYHVLENALVRIEQRSFFTDKKVFEDKKAISNNSNYIVGSICVWF
jgi:hypothetical protein